MSDSTDVPTVGPASQILISMDDLLSNKAYILGVESRNKAVFNNINYDLLKQNLVTWASTGFPDYTNIYSFPIEISNGSICSDGNIRDCWEYLPFLLGMPIGQFVAGIGSKLSGINLTYSFNTELSTLNIHASR